MTAAEKWRALMDAQRALVAADQEEERARTLQRQASDRFDQLVAEYHGITPGRTVVQARGCRYLVTKAASWERHSYGGAVEPMRPQLYGRKIRRDGTPAAVENYISAIWTVEPS